MKGKYNGVRLPEPKAENRSGCCGHVEGSAVRIPVVLLAALTKVG
jgi:hypothetical protein